MADFGSTVLTEEDYRDQADFRCAMRKFLHFSEQQARSQGITPQQHILLLVVRGHASYPGVTIGEVAEALQIRHHSASLLVDRCVKRGMLSRREDPKDRRRALLALTADGERVLDAITRHNRLELSSLKGSLFRDSLQQAIDQYNAADRESYE